MPKMFLVGAMNPDAFNRACAPYYNDKDAAIAAAKKMAHSNSKRGETTVMTVFEAIGTVEVPVPDVEFKEIK